MRTIFIAIAMALILGVLGWIKIPPAWNQFVERDSCLDLGGRWDDYDDVCDASTNPGDMSPYDQCLFYDGEWNNEEDVCVGSEGDPWP